MAITITFRNMARFSYYFLVTRVPIKLPNMLKVILFIAQNNANIHENKVLNKIKSPDTPASLHMAIIWCWNHMMK